MQHGMFDAADVLVDAHPVAGSLFVKGRLVVSGRAVAQEIPGRIHEGVHGVRLSPGRAAAFRTGRLDKRFGFSQRRASPCRSIPRQRAAAQAGPFPAQAQCRTVSQYRIGIGVPQ